MKDRRFALLSFCLLSACGGAKQHTAAIAAPPVSQAAAAPVVPPKLQLKVVTGSPDGFLGNSTLVTGDKDAVLIDARFRLEDASFRGRPTRRPRTARRGAPRSAKKTE
jgi:hypothetical protein